MRKYKKKVAPLALPKELLHGYTKEKTRLFSCIPQNLIVPLRRHEACATHHSCYCPAAHYAFHNGSSSVVLPSDTELGGT